MSSVDGCGTVAVHVSSAFERRPRCLPVVAENVREAVRKLAEECLNASAIGAATESTIAIVAALGGDGRAGRRRGYARDCVLRPLVGLVHLLLAMWERSFRGRVPVPLAMFVKAAALAAARRCHPLGEGEPKLLVDAPEAALLLLDDLGQDERRDNVMMDVLDARYDAGLPTVCTSGFTLEQLSERYGQALVRRITETNGKGRIVNLFKPAVRAVGGEPRVLPSLPFPERRRSHNRAPPRGRDPHPPRPRRSAPGQPPDSVYRARG